MANHSRIKPLDDEIFLVQLETFTTKFDNQTKREMNKSLKWLKLAFVPYGVCIGASLLTQNMIPLIAGTTYVSAVSIVKMIKDDQEFERNLKQKYNPDPKITYLDQTGADFTFLSEPIVSKKAADYYREEFVKMAEEPPKPVLKIVDSSSQENNDKPEEPSTEEILNKEETMIQLAAEYRTYKTAYKLPEFKVRNKEWDLLFDTMYDRLKELSLEDRLYELMSFTQRYVFADSLVNKRKEITIHSYLNQLPMLEKVGLADFGIDSIVSEIRSKLSPPKTIILDIKKLKKQK